MSYEMEELVYWESCEKDLKRKEDKSKRSEIFGGIIKGGAVLSGDGKVQDGPLRERQ